MAAPDSLLPTPPTVRACHIALSKRTTALEIII